MDLKDGIKWESTEEMKEFEANPEYKTCNLTKVDNGFIATLGADPERILAFEMNYDSEDREAFQEALVNAFYNIAEYFGLGNDIIKSKDKKTLVIDLKEDHEIQA